MARTPSSDQVPTEDQRSRWRQAQEFLSNLALLLTIVGVAAVVGGGLLFTWVEDLRGFAQGVLAIGGILLLVALISSFATVRVAVTGQRGRFTTNAIVMVVTVATIAVLVNFISYQNPQRFDTTFTRQFSLAPQTLDVLANLEKLMSSDGLEGRVLEGPVRATAFFTPARSEVETATRQRAEDLMSEFQRRSERRFTYRFEDPELDPGIAAQYNVFEYPVIVFEAVVRGEERQYPLRVPPLAEQDLTSALLVITGEEQKVVFFLSGHGEKDLESVDAEDASGMGFAAQGVFNDSYIPVPMVLESDLFQGRIPDATAVLVVAGPQRDLSRVEQEELLRWLKEGGRALFLMDPGSPSTYRDLLGEWGIRTGEETVVDLGSSVHQAPRTPLLQRPQYGGTERITSALDVTFFPNATSMNIPQELQEDPRKIPPWMRYTLLALSSGASFGTEDPNRDTFDRGKDSLGPHVLAMSVQACSLLGEETEEVLLPFEEGLRCVSSDATRNPTSIVIIGDSDFASNRNFYAYTNSDLFLNAVNWLAEDYDLISIRSKPIVFRELVVTTSEFNFIRYSSWFLLPAAVALGGLVSWWRRR